MRFDRRWLYPGMGVKRWLLTLLVGLTAIALGLAYFMVHLYRTQPFPEWVYYATLQFLPRWVRGLLFLSVGLGLSGLGFYRLQRALLDPLRRSRQRHAPLAEIVYRDRLTPRGPRVVAIGGGTGLSTLLRGLRRHPIQITAIVTVADDGGSSGRLRRDLGMLPPGDFRNCLVALSEEEELLQRLFQYRFPEGELKGHSFGNLFIAALQGVTGSFEEAIRESSRVLAVRGRVLPSTLTQVRLGARVERDGTEEVVWGESRIPEVRGRIREVFLDPREAEAYPEAVEAILQADLIVLGPGSLYTSVLPNLLVPGIAEALRATAAPRIYVANMATQPGETDGYGLRDHVQALFTHVGDRAFEAVLCNDSRRYEDRIRPEWGVQLVLPEPLEDLGLTLFTADLTTPRTPLRHDPEVLARELLRLLPELSRSRRTQGAVVAAGR